MSPQKKELAIIIACILIIAASAFVWRMQPAKAMKPCDAEFTVYTPTRDGDKLHEKLKILKDNRSEQEYILYNGQIIKR